MEPDDEEPEPIEEDPVSEAEPEDMGWRPGGAEAEARGRGVGGKEEAVKVDGRAEPEAVREDEVGERAGEGDEVGVEGGSRRGGGRSRGWAKGHRGRDDADDRRRAERGLPVTRALEEFMDRRSLGGCPA
ncbi:hypothetical protein NL676_022953 [Syzygium grande]|nr:hypothetical protein NL676_022953 [Syzygium grande]